MRKWMMVAAAGVVGLAGWALYASNLASRTDVQLFGPGASAVTGTQTICFPYNRSDNLTDAASVRDDVNQQAGQDVFVSLARFDNPSETLQIYDGDPADNFSLQAGEGYQLRVSQDFTYTILGSDDPSLLINLKAGSNELCPPVNFAPQTAGELFTELEGFSAPGAISAIQRWLPASDAFQSYTGDEPGANFTIEQNRSYRVIVGVDVDYIPSRD